MKKLGQKQPMRPFPGDENLLQEKDRRTKVSFNQFKAFPVNSIGWI